MERPSSPGSRGRYVSGDPVHDLASARSHEWLATCVSVQDVLSQGILSSSTVRLVAFQSVWKEALHVTANWWSFLTLLKHSKFFSFFTLQLCHWDLRIPVCLLTGYNILNW